MKGDRLRELLSLIEEIEQMPTVMEDKKIILSQFRRCYQKSIGKSDTDRNNAILDLCAYGVLIKVIEYPSGYFSLANLKEGKKDIVADLEKFPNQKWETRIKKKTEAKNI